MCQWFQIDKSLRSGSCCAFLHPDHIEKGKKKISDDIKVKPENLGKNSKLLKKERINQLKATAKHLSENILTLGKSTGLSKRSSGS